MTYQIFQNTNRKNLLQLIWLRLIAIIGQVITILFVNFILEIELNLTVLFGVIIILGVVNLLSFYRYKIQKKISDKSLFFELIFDVLALSLQLYFSGGVSNPFISLFLLQVIISAILLRRIYAWLIALLTLFCYIVLSFNYQELHAFHHHSNEMFNLHLHGMLISYVITAILVLIFITKIIKNLKEGDDKIHLLKQKSHAKEQLVRSALLTTSTAHELGTPLSTIAVILGDWKQMNLKKEMLEELLIMENQVQRCKKILYDILDISGKKRYEHATLTSLKTAFDNLISKWSDLRKPQNLIYNFIGESEKKIIFDEVIIHAFFNVFDNALEASPDYLKITAMIVKNNLEVSVEDHGKGFDQQILKHLGQENLSTKNSSGLGLFLALNAIKNIDGDIKFTNLKSIGVKVLITIPQKNL